MSPNPFWPMAWIRIHVVSFDVINKFQKKYATPKKQSDWLSDVSAEVSNPKPSFWIAQIHTYTITHGTEVELLRHVHCTVGRIRWAEKRVSQKTDSVIISEKFKSVWHFSVMFSTNYFSILLCWTLTSFGSKRKKLKA